MPTSFRLDDKVIIVTGGTGILGDSFITAIAEAGGIVGIGGRKREVAEERALRINNNGGKAFACVMDVMNETQVKAAAEKVMDNYGRVDGLVNAAGGVMPQGVLQPQDDLFKMNLQGMSDASKFVTGAMICVDGGFSIFGGV